MTTELTKENIKGELEKDEPGVINTSTDIASYVPNQSIEVGVRDENKKTFTNCFKVLLKKGENYTVSDILYFSDQGNLTVLKDATMKQIIINEINQESFTDLVALKTKYEEVMKTYFDNYNDRKIITVTAAT